MESFAETLNLRFKALRVHRECSRVYASLSSWEYVPAIRLDHYYCWLFQPAIMLDDARLRSLAVGNVLVSDAVFDVQNSIHAGAKIDWRSGLHSALLRKGLSLLCSGQRNTEEFERRAAEIVHDQEAAMCMEENLYHARERTEFDELAHLKNQSAYLRLVLAAMGSLSRDSFFYQTIREAQDCFTCASAIYNSLLRWRMDVQHPFCNFVLRKAWTKVSDWTEMDRIADAIYYGGIGAEAIQMAMEFLVQAREKAASCEGFRQLAEMLETKSRGLHNDLLSLASVN